MDNKLIHHFIDTYVEYLRDESRTVGKAESISFPKTEQEVIYILSHMSAQDIPVTVQGARTGLAAAAVPDGGHIMNLSLMDKVTALCQDAQGRFYVTVQPGVILSRLRKSIENRQFDTVGWDIDSQKAYAAFCEASEQFFPPDPTETSASIGGMASCNASGARSLRYGSIRGHISRLRVVLCDGQTLSLERGKNFAQGRRLKIKTEQGNIYDLKLPGYHMPQAKNASGYYIDDNMDAIDLFIGSDGTLGVITELELALSPLPAVIWGVNCFFTREEDAISFVINLRTRQENVASIEFFDRDALSILRTQKEENLAFSQLPDTDPAMDSVISVELHCNTEEQAAQQLFEIGGIMDRVGGDQYNSWVARTAADLNVLAFFRHAVPESVNMLIDRRKRDNPAITKLGTDMSVPNEHLGYIMKMYHAMLKQRRLESAIWGHIGANHLHVNILPGNEQDFLSGKELYALWAEEVSRLGGAVSAEHGVGKLKAGFLSVMYGQKHIEEMIALKATLDPKGILGVGNLFKVKNGGRQA